MQKQLLESTNPPNRNREAPFHAQRACGLRIWSSRTWQPEELAPWEGPQVTLRIYRAF